MMESRTGQITVILEGEDTFSSERGGRTKLRRAFSFGYRVGTHKLTGLHGGANRIQEFAGLTVWLFGLVLLPLRSREGL
jgi:hypothetical protein